MADKNLLIEYIEISDIKPYEKNARKHTKKDIKTIVESIQQFGFNDPIGIWSDEKLIVEGHGRLLAAKELGMDKVPCIRLDHLTEEQRRAYALAHNKTAEMSEWDMDLLPEELSGIECIDMEMFGFDLVAAEDGNVTEDDYEDEVPVETNIKYGDIYQLGDHRLMCGDATLIDDCQNLLGGGVQADLLITDPPYNVDYTGKGKDKLTIKNDSMIGEKFRSFLVDAFAIAYASIKLGAPFYVWYAAMEHSNFDAALKECGFLIKQQLIWEKNSLVIGRQDYQWIHEPCLYGWKEGASHKWYSDRKQATVLHFDRPTKNDIHPTMKPIKLFDYQIKNSTKEGDIVLDLFCGSGTTIMACEQNGRCARCMELDPRYVDATIKRWEKFTGKKAVLIGQKAV